MFVAVNNNLTSHRVHCCRLLQTQDVCCKVHLLAHSMGNLVLFNAIVRASVKQDSDPDVWGRVQYWSETVSGVKALRRLFADDLGRCGTVTLAAADLSWNKAVDLLNKLNELGSRQPLVTLYCSRWDLAVAMSTAMRGFGYRSKGRIGFFQRRATVSGWDGHRIHPFLQERLDTIEYTGAEPLCCAWQLTRRQVAASRVPTRRCCLMAGSECFGGLHVFCT